MFGKFNVKLIYTCFCENSVKIVYCLKNLNLKTKYCFKIIIDKKCSGAISPVGHPVLMGKNKKW